MWYKRSIWVARARRKGHLPVRDIVLVKVFEGWEALPHYCGGFFLWESLFLDDVVEELAAFAVPVKNEKWNWKQLFLSKDQSFQRILYRLLTQSQGSIYRATPRSHGVWWYSDDPTHIKQQQPRSITRAYESFENFDFVFESFIVSHPAFLYRLHRIPVLYKEEILQLDYSSVSWIENLAKFASKYLTCSPFLSKVNHSEASWAQPFDKLILFLDVPWVGVDKPLLK